VNFCRFFLRVLEEKNEENEEKMREKDAKRKPREKTKRTLKVIKSVSCSLIKVKVKGLTQMNGSLSSR